MFESIIKGIDRFIDTLGRGLIFLSLLLVLIVGTDVALRYFFNISYTSLREMEWHCYSLIFLLGASYTLRHDAHVRVDVIYQHMPTRLKALINVLGALILMFPGFWLIMKTSVPFVKFSWMMHEVSPDPGGLPYRWLLKSAIPLGFALLSLQGVSFTLKNLLVLTGRREPEAEEA